MGLELLTQAPQVREGPGCPGIGRPRHAGSMALDPGSHSGSPPLPGQAGRPGNSLGPERARPSRRARARPDPDRGPAAPLRPIPRTGKETTHLCAGSAARQPYVRSRRLPPSPPGPHHPTQPATSSRSNRAAAGPEGPARPGPVPGEARWGHRSHAASPQAMTTTPTCHPPSTLVEPSPADHRHPAGRRNLGTPWPARCPRRDSCGARRPGTGSARPAAAARGPGAWPVGGARAEPPPLHAPRAAQGSWRGCGASGTVGGAGGELRTGRGGGGRLGPSRACSCSPLPSPRSAHGGGAGAMRGWEPGGRATPSDSSDSLCFGQFLTEPPKSVHKEGTPPDQDKARPLRNLQIYPWNSLPV